MNLSGRIAAYARFSTDRQSPTSCDDQIEKLRAYARGRGAELERTFADEAVSGAIRERPGLLALVRAIDAGDLDIVIVEDLGRLSRDVEDLAWLRKRLAFRSVRLIAIDDGIDTESAGAELMGDVLGGFKALYRREVAAKTIRGMEAKARAGLATGAVPYGYRTVRVDAGAEIRIDEDAARVVREIFARYADGESLSVIATELNRRDVLPPRGGRPRHREAWGTSTVRAVLHNACYAGHWTFGKRKWDRDPDTRRRQPRERADALVETERPELAIIDADTWAAVRGRFRTHTTMYTGRNHIPIGQRWKTHALSGILVCAHCSKPLTIGGGKEGKRYYSCSGSRRGTCDQRRWIQETVIRDRVIAGIRERFSAAELQADLEAMIGAERDRVDASELRRREVAAIVDKSETRMRRLVLAIADGDAPTAVMQAIRGLEETIASGRAELARLAAAPRPKPLELPSIAEVLDGLEDAMQGPPELAREALRQLLDGGTIAVRREADGSIRARGGLLPAMLLGGCSLVDCGGRIIATERGLPSGVFDVELWRPAA